MLCVDYLTINFYTEAGLRIALGFVFDVEEVGGDLRESSSIRDTLRLYNLWGDGPNGFAVSLVESVQISSTYLRSNFASRFFIDDLDAHVKQHNLEICITEVILDYIWMPDNWSLKNYGSHQFGILKNLLNLAQREAPYAHIKPGGIVYLPTPWQFYHGLVTSAHWSELTRIFNVDYIDHKDSNLHPLVRSDIAIQDSIAKCGKDIHHNLELLVRQGEEITSLIKSDVYHWRGTSDIFMKLTCKCRKTIQRTVKHL